MKQNKLAANLALAKDSRFIHVFLLITILLVTPGHFVSGQEIKGKTFIVAPGGSDRNPGTRSQPLATFEAARDAARMAEPGNHRIIVMPGEYYLTRSNGPVR